MPHSTQHLACDNRCEALRPPSSPPSSRFLNPESACEGFFVKKTAVVIHLQIYVFTPSHLQIYIFTPSHLLICIFTPSHLLTLHTLTSADLHLHTFTSADLHLHTFTSADLHLHTFTSADLLSLLLSFSRSSFYFSLKGGRCRRSATKRDGRSISCTSDVQNLAKIANLRCPPQPFRTKWTLILNAKNRGKIAILVGPPQPFRTKWTLDAKNCGKIAILRYPSQPFRTKWTLDVKNCGKIAILVSLPQPVRTKWMLDVKNWCKIIHRSLRNFPGGTLSYWNNFSGLILWNNLRGERGGRLPPDIW